MAPVGRLMGGVDVRFDNVGGFTFRSTTYCHDVLACRAEKKKIFRFGS